MLSEQDKTFLGKIFLNYNLTMTTAQLNKEKAINDMLVANLISN